MSGLYLQGFGKEVWTYLLKEKNKSTKEYSAAKNLRTYVRSTSTTFLTREIYVCPFRPLHRVPHDLESGSP